jgi:wyosine [tRNA(Phe)-imidazoG37] synthetase (radical SAM superfamily)
VGRFLDYRDHRRTLGGNQHVYAVLSRRAAGVSIGVNLNPDKRCNFACPYCQVDRDRRASASAVDVRQLVAELNALLSSAANGTLWHRAPFDTVAPLWRRVADIAFSGDGEPTLAASFPEAARRARHARDSRARGVPLRLLTNATLLHRPRVRAALIHFDELWCKLDAGTERSFRVVSGSRIAFSRVLDNLLEVSRRRPIVVQSLFFACRGSGPPADEIDAYLERLGSILAHGGRISRVQVYTVARAPANPHVAPLRVAALDAIAERVRTLGVAADVHG